MQKLFAAVIINYSSSSFDQPDLICNPPEFISIVILSPARIYCFDNTRFADTLDELFQQK